MLEILYSSLLRLYYGIHDDRYNILHKTIPHTFDRFYIQGVVDHYGFMEQIKKLEIKLEGKSLHSFMSKAWPYSLLFFVTFLIL
jgi:hypothetical protein